MTIFPKTAMISAGCDVLLDGQLHFAQKLKLSGIKVKHIITKGMVHGFLTYGNRYEKEISSVINSAKNFIYETLSPEREIVA